MNLIRRNLIPFIVLFCFTIIMTVRAFQTDFITLNLVLLNLIILSMSLNSRRITLYTGIASGLVYGLLWFTPFVPHQTKNEIMTYWGTMVLFFIFTGFSMFLLEGNSKFHQSLKHFFLLYENATEGILISDERGRIVMANPTTCRFFGYEENELLNQSIEILIPAKYRHNHPKMRMNYMKNPQNRAMGRGMDLYGTRKDGTMFPIEISLSSYSDNQRKFVIAFIIDISLRKENELLIHQKTESLEKMSQELARLNEDLEHKVEERTNNLTQVMKNLEKSRSELREALEKEKELSEIKSRFVSMASHEFRTPLSSVLSSASLLQRYTHTEDQPNRDKHIRRIKDSVRHLNDILEDFLSLGKLDENKIHALPESISITEIIHQAIEDASAVKKEKQQIHFDLSGLDQAIMDKNLLKNICINLLTNAIKFSNDTGNIEVHCVNTADKLRVSITDHGIGIPEEDQEHLFTSFFRSKNAVNIQGTGLGLHIVKRYLDLMGGEAFVKSRLNQGTTITITIPHHQINHDQ